MLGILRIGAVLHATGGGEREGEWEGSFWWPKPMPSFELLFDRFPRWALAACLVRANLCQLAHKDDPPSNNKSGAILRESFSAVHGAGHYKSRIPQPAQFAHQNGIQRDVNIGRSNAPLFMFP